MVTIDDLSVGTLCCQVLARRRPGERLSELSLPQVRKFFALAVKELGLERFGLKPYSIRRGGASWDFRSHGDIARTIFRGRWDSAKTARIYVVDGTAALAEQHLNSLEKLKLLTAISNLSKASMGSVEGPGSS